MTMDRSIARDRISSLALGTAGALLVALAIFASLDYRNGCVAGLAGAGGMALWRQAALGRWRGTVIIFDALAFAIFAFQRNDYLAFWQLVGPWSDVPRFNIAGAAIAYAVYVIGSLFAMTTAHRSLRAVEAIGLIGIPFLFNLLVVLGADWHMGELIKFVLPGNMLPFPVQVFIGRTLTLFAISEAGLAVLSYIGVNRMPVQARFHGLLFISAAI